MAVQPCMEWIPIKKKKVKFHLPFSSPYFFTKPFLSNIPTNTSFLYTLAIFRLSIFTCCHPWNPHQKSFPLPWPSSQFRLRKGPNEQVTLFNFSLLLRSMDRDKSTQWSMILCQIQKIGILQVVASNICDQNDKRSTPPSLIHSIYYHYFHTLLIP